MPPGPDFLQSLPVMTVHSYTISHILEILYRDALSAKPESALQEQPGGSTLKEGCASQQHAGKMRLNLRMAAASLALLDECSDHCLESLAVTLHVSAPCNILHLGTSCSINFSDGACNSLLGNMVFILMVTSRHSCRMLTCTLARLRRLASHQGG